MIDKVRNFEHLNINTRVRKVEIKFLQAYVSKNIFHEQKLYLFAL